MLVRTAACTVLAAALLAPPGAAAQVRASERAMVAQTVDGTTITVTYARPQVRGRDNIFGRVVRMGEVWTPGANWATTVGVDRDVTIDGHAVTAGEYSLWLIPAAGDWTAVLHPDAKRFHTQPPKDGGIRFTVAPRTVAHTEVLTFSFPEVRRDGTVLRLAWAATEVAFDVRVTPTRLGEVDLEAIAPYLGRYELRFEPREPGGRQPPPMRADVIEQDGDLLVRITPHFDRSVDPEMALIPAGTPHAFLPASRKDGVLFDIESEMQLVFIVQGARAEQFEMRGLKGAVMGRAVRQP